MNEKLMLSGTKAVLVNVSLNCQYLANKLVNESCSSLLHSLTAFLISVVELITVCIQVKLYFSNAIVQQIYNVVHKKEANIFVWYFVKSQRILMQLSLTLNVTCDSMNFTHLT